MCLRKLFNRLPFGWLLSKLFDFLSFEWLLKYYPNSGTVVFLRSFFTSVLVYLLAIGLKSRLEPNAIWSFNWLNFKSAIKETIPWFGAIFAGTYAIFYSRFSSQWTYLANLYNQIMETQTKANILDADFNDKDKPISKWMAGFIEDAYTLHLDRKEMFSPAIKSMLRHKGVRECLKSHSDGKFYESLAARIGYKE